MTPPQNKTKIRPTWPTSVTYKPNISFFFWSAVFKLMEILPYHFEFLIQFWEGTKTAKIQNKINLLAEIEIWEIFVSIFLPKKCDLGVFRKV